MITADAKRLHTRHTTSQVRVTRFACCDVMTTLTSCQSSISDEPALGLGDLAQLLGLAHQAQRRHVVERHRAATRRSTGGAAGCGAVGGVAARARVQHVMHVLQRLVVTLLQTAGTMKSQ